MWVEPGQLYRLIGSMLVIVSSIQCSGVDLPDDRARLLKLMESPDLEVAVSAAQKVDRLYGEDALIEAAETGNTQARTWAASLLAGHDSARSKSTLLLFLRDDSADVRRAAVIALRGLCDRTCIPSIRPLLNDSDASVRDMAQVSLHIVETK